MARVIEDRTPPRLQQAQPARQSEAQTHRHIDPRIEAEVIDDLDEFDRAAREFCDAFLACMPNHAVLISMLQARNDMAATRTAAFSPEKPCERMSPVTPAARDADAIRRPADASIGENGHAKFEAATGVHDDLVLALALWRLQLQAKKAAA
jgi:hypothetical protein